MKKIYIGMAAAAVMLASCKKEEKVETTDVDVTTKDTVVMEEPAPEQPMDSAAMQEAWMAYMTPGEQHEMLADETGKWDCEMKMWMDPNGEPEISQCTADIKMLFGGRYQDGMYKGEVMGGNFEGRSTVAYDNATNEYTSTWIDNMGTGLMVMKGKMDDGANTITFTGEGIDPTTGKTCKMREVYTLVDNNTRKMEMYDSKTGQEMKSLEIVIKRK